MNQHTQTGIRQTSRIKRFLPIAMVVAMAAIMVSPASGMAFRFGSKLTTEVQPSNAGNGHECQPNPGMCTWAMGEAYGRPNGGERSPFTGTLRRIRLIAQVPGSFRLQIVKVRPDGTAKLIRNGRKVNYQGQPVNEDPESYRIESFRVKLPIKKGQRLAIKTSSTSLVRCSSGGPNSLLYQPPLLKGAGFRQASEDDGCWLLLEAIGRKRR